MNVKQESKRKANKIFRSNQNEYVYCSIFKMRLDLWNEEGRRASIL